MQFQILLVITSYSIHYTKLYDGEWDEAAVLLNFSAHETKEITVDQVPGNEAPVFEKRTNLRLGIEQEDGSYKEVDDYQALPCTTEFKIIAQGERNNFV